MHILENNALRIEIADHGAELCSVFDKQSDQERFWTADPAVWNRHSPILFPFVGKVTGGKYRIGEREYSMKTQHGFARDLEFECVEETDNAVTHALSSTERTQEIYPYQFYLQITHEQDRENPRLLHVRWRVENRDTETMYYSIGGHPGFLMPSDVQKEDCFLVFPGQKELRYFSANSEGFALPEKQRCLSPEDGYVRYQSDIPDTWIFTGNTVREVGIALPDKKPYVTLHCEQFPMLAVWANPNGTFICLEPWFGRTDDAGFQGTLAKKPGIETLAPREAKDIQSSLLFHE